MRKILVLMVASMSMAAFAQQAKKPVQRAPTQEIIFDGDVIDGTLKAPDVEYVDGTLAARHPSLIKVREEFKDKVLNSAGEL